MRLAQPMAQHIGLARSTQLLQRGNARRAAYLGQVLLRQLLQQLAGLGGMCCTAGKGIAKRGEGGLQRRQQLRTDAVARVLRILVAGVFHPILATRAQPVAHMGAGHLQQRTVPMQPRRPPMRRHGGQPRHPGTARQGQKQSFDLVIRMLRQSY
jgi:hypothetical protein